jgi:hypothetical protein
LAERPTFLWINNLASFSLFFDFELFIVYKVDSAFLELWPLGKLSFSTTLEKDRSVGALETNFRMPLIYSILFLSRIAGVKHEKRF